MNEQYIGIDLHKSFFQACALTVDGTRLWEDRFPTTGEGLAAFRERCGPAVRVAVEASGPTWAFADHVSPAVGQLLVVDPRKTKLKAGYAAKTDRLDARRLADALRRDSVVGIYVPPPAIRDLRELCRYRCSLVRLRVGLKQRVHALLVRQGVPVPAVSDLFGRKGQQWLADLRLAGWAGVSLHGLLQLVRDVLTQLEAIEPVVRTYAARDPIARALDTIPGIGAVLAVMIRAEIGTIERFDRPAQLASYAGLVPRVTQSGRLCRTGAITKQGSPWLRWALVEAGVQVPRRPDALGRWARRLAGAKGAGKARIAAARVLCGEIFRVWLGADGRLSPPAIADDMTRGRVDS